MTTHIRHRCDNRPCKKVTVNIYITGHLSTVKVPDHYPLWWALPNALSQAGHTGYPPNLCELRDEAGTLLDTATDIPIKDWHFTSRTKLFLNLPTGIGD